MLNILYVTIDANKEPLFLSLGIAVLLL